MRSVVVMFLARLGSLNALEQSKRSRFWGRWLGRAMPSADTIGRVCALADPADIRVVTSREIRTVKRQINGQDEQLSSEWIWVTTLSKAQPTTNPVVQLGHDRWKIENEGFNELANRRHGDHVYKHDARAMLVFCLLGMLCMNVFGAFYRRNLKPPLRRAVSMLHISRQIAAELYENIRNGPTRAPT